METKFDRAINLIGIDKFNKLSNLSILLVGLGGVGGSVLEGLVRSGFKNITIVDNDKISITNLNRQVISNINNIDNYKVDQSIKFAKSINDKINIKGINIKISEENINELFKDKIDIIIDCIDDSKAKIALYKYSINNNIPLISSMGTANKLDPTKLEISKLSKTSGDKLAKKLRILCKENNIDSNKIIVVYSKEEPITNITNPLPSMMMVPTSCAMVIVSYIIKNLIE